MADTTTTTPSNITLSISHRRQQLELSLPPTTSLYKIQSTLIQEHTGILPEHQKIIHKGKTLTNPQTTLGELAAISTATTKVVKVVLIGSNASELAAIQQGPPPSLGNLRIINDLTTTHTHSSSHAHTPILRPRQYGFQSIEVLPHLHEKDKATQILTTLATDPGILHVMDKYKWSVGALCEMMPEGYVGVSDVCVMGLNVNQGQKILLRLRTDDLKGWRKILSIRKVLYHEMAHNVHSPHNDDFYILMRKIEKEVNAFNGSGRALGGAMVAGGEGLGAGGGGGGLSSFVGGSGRLGGASAELTQLLSAREMAGQAAVARRLTEEEEEIEAGCASSGGGGGHGHHLHHHHGGGGKEEESEEEEVVGVQVHTRPHDESSPVVTLGQEEREVVPLPTAAAEVPPVAVEETETEKAEVVVVEEDATEGERMELSSPPQALATTAAPAVPDSILPTTPSPSVDVASSPSLPASSALDDATEQLLALGFAEAQVRRALHKCGGDVMRAADLLLLTTGDDGVDGGSSGMEEGEGQGNKALSSATAAAGVPQEESNDTMTTMAAALPPNSREARVLDAAQRLIQQTHGDPQGRESAFSTLHAMLQAILDNPQEGKYKRVRLSNAKFMRAVGRFPAGLDLLKVVGFEEKEEEGQAMLILGRQDPGLLWWGKSAVEAAQQQQQRQRQQQSNV